VCTARRPGNFETTQVPLAFVALTLALLGALGWQALLVITRRENPAWVRWLQNQRLVQTPRHHGRRDAQAG